MIDRPHFIQGRGRRNRENLEAVMESIQLEMPSMKLVCCPTCNEECSGQRWDMWIATADRENTVSYFSPAKFVCFEEDQPSPLYLNESENTGGRKPKWTLCSGELFLLSICNVNI